jgi:hypothetical protein
MNGGGPLSESETGSVWLVPDFCRARRSLKETSPVIQMNIISYRPCKIPLDDTIKPCCSYTHQIPCPSIDVQSFDSIKFCHVKELQKHQNQHHHKNQDVNCHLIGEEGSSLKYQIHKVNDPVIECTIDLEAFLQHLISSSFVVISTSDAS